MLETAVVAARLAGQRAMEEQRYISRSIKNGVELVTQADPICQKIIIDRIREAYPDHGFLAEEGTDGKPLMWAPRGDQAIWWIIDPIDGTNNYANGLLCFSVSIAAFFEGRPVVAVIFDPTTESMFTAVRDGDAQLNTARIAVNDDGIDTFSQFAVEGTANPNIDNGMRTLWEKCRIRCLGSTALHLAYVARGALIGAISTGGKLWDIAAGILLVECAGGNVTDPAGNPLPAVDLTQYDGGKMPVLASNGKTQKELLNCFKNK
jgi:myo-inositol-1(or 4)-monophosphatase